MSRAIKTVNAYIAASEHYQPSTPALHDFNRAYEEAKRRAIIDLEKEIAEIKELTLLDHKTHYHIVDQEEL